ncbi:MAG: hypothetical protein IH987_12715, partial [Planctomycetes bacterium]|nr:hypothetical protein [Planctomycetota bacterium]
GRRGGGFRGGGPSPGKPGRPVSDAGDDIFLEQGGDPRGVVTQALEDFGGVLPEARRPPDLEEQMGWEIPSRVRVSPQGHAKELM